MTIVTLAQSACEKLRDIDTLTQQKQHADDIKATYKELSNTLTFAVQVRERFLLLRMRLDLEEVLTDFQKILSATSTLRQQFVEGVQLRQVNELRSVQIQLNRVVSKIDGKWKSYATGRAKGIFDLLDVVLQDPEMRSRELSIRGLESRLKGYLSRTPETQEALADFDRCFTELQKYTSQVQNLPEDVLAFLKKVHEGRATMADVTDEVVRWCRQRERAHTFKISLSFY